MATHVRLKPYDHSKGHKLRVLVLTQLGGIAFEEGKIVEKIEGKPISPHAERLLKLVRQNGYVDTDGQYPNVPFAFDVLDEDAMRRLVASEAKARLGLSPEVMNALRDEFGRTEESSASAAATAAPKPRRTRANQAAA